jgi:hypothetical protein
VQSIPDWFSFGGSGFVDALRIIGNAVPPLLSFQFAGRIAELLLASDLRARTREEDSLPASMNDQDQDGYVSAS